MALAEIERLKREWSGRRVEVGPSSPSLQRFAGRSGTVVTLNMNGRALVRFDGSADVGWYDIPLEDLRIVAAPVATKEVAPTAPGEPKVASETGAEAKSAAAPMPPVAASKPRPKTILELAREQGAAKKT